MPPARKRYNMPDRDRPLPPVPESKGLPRSRTRLSLVWFIPILAALVGVYVAVTRILAEGPVITIVFQSAEGLEAGKTKIHYNGVDIGTATAIRLSEDHQRVIIKAQMAPKTEEFLAEDTKFWVVRPRISGANVTGLGTLISGAYIGLEIGDSKEHKRDFVGRETPRAGFAGRWHASLLPAAASRPGLIVRARPRRQDINRESVRAGTLRPV